MNVLEIIEQYDTICLFRHQIADMDALGSQFGLKQFIMDHYPNKKVYCLGQSLGSAAYLFPNIDEVEDHVIQDSLAIVLDTANVERIDDARYAQAKYIVKIDHHVEIEDFGHARFVNVNASATCEVLVDLIRATQASISKESAKYLYFGLLADSANFTTSNTTAHTLAVASYLVGCGLDVNQILQERTNLRLNDFRYVSDIRSSAIVEDKVIYAVMNKESYQKYGLSYNEAKEKVFCMANINEMEMWCLFTQDEADEDGLFNGSLRSKRYAIDEVANQFNGGGHKQACGVKKLTLQDIDTLVETLNTLSR